MLDVAEREATEDIQKLGGVEALGAPYLSIELLMMIRKRAPWLVARLGGLIDEAAVRPLFAGLAERLR